MQQSSAVLQIWYYLKNKILKNITDKKKEPIRATYCESCCGQVKFPTIIILTLFPHHNIDGTICEHTIENHAHGRHKISRRLRIVAPIPKQTEWVSGVWCQVSCVR